MTNVMPSTTPYSPAVPGRPAAPLLETLADELDIALSLYAKAADRHKTVGAWLCRPESSLARYGPQVRPQGSFRYGTVIKPIVEDARYDLDQVVVLENLRSAQLSQADLKAKFGAELTAYAHTYGMQSPEPKHRCWRLNYRDEVPFHLDSVPSVPASPSFVLQLREEGVNEPWATPAVAITDDRHPGYTMAGAEWLTSNPRGFARWLESRAALGLQESIAKGTRASVEGVPAYTWKTPLQRAIQILKRHRDVMFRTNPEIAPISMIITNLAARAYQGEQDVGAALIGIVERMGQYVRPTYPRVPNPTHPAEDYADKWRMKPILEASFNDWLMQVQSDVRNLVQAQFTPTLLERKFAVRLADEQQRKLAPYLATSMPAPAIVTSPSAPRAESAPRPWRRAD